MNAGTENGNEDLVITHSPACQWKSVERESENKRESNLKINKSTDRLQSGWLITHETNMFRTGFACEQDF